MKIPRQFPTEGHRTIAPAVDAQVAGTQVASARSVGVGPRDAARRTSAPSASAPRAPWRRTTDVEPPDSRTRRGLRFSSEHASLTGVELSNIRFAGCDFDGTPLSESSMQGCEFVDCDFRGVSFSHSRLRDCTFRGCDFREAMLVATQLHGVLFERCDIAASSFEDARIGPDCAFREVGLAGTHFLCAEVSGCAIERSDLTDAVFFGTERGFDIDEASRRTARLTRSTTVTLVSPASRGVSVPRVGRKIAEVADMLPLRVAMRAPTLQPGPVDAEIEQWLDKQAATTGAPQSLARRLVMDAIEKPGTLPNAARVMAKARTLVAHADSVVLPGGEDVSPRLYGQHPAPETDWRGDHRRSLLELGLVHHCFHRGVPLMAICRGFQITSIYFGARLHQHVGQQVGVRILDEGAPAEDRGLYGGALANIRAAVYHHQAVDAADDLPHLRTALSRTIVDTATGARWTAVMALESSQARAPLIGVQFHPEFFEDGAVRPESASIDNDRLDALANAYVRPGASHAGLHEPDDLVASGILDHASPGNDALWTILSVAADAHRARTAVTPQRLRERRAGLRG